MIEMPVVQPPDVLTDLLAEIRPLLTGCSLRISGVFGMGNFIMEL